ncbi:MAG: phosphate ABC transporter ATP-binding protein, partial [Verrucomicrobiota bacterium]
MPEETETKQKTDAAAHPKLRVSNLDFYYDQFRALQNISLDIEEAKVTAFIG